MTTKHKCSKEVWRNIRWYPCSRPATVEHNGKWYCWQHDPRRMKANAEKRRVSQEIKRNVLVALWKRRARNAKLAKLVTPELASLLEDIVSGKTSRYGRIQRESARALAALIREVLAQEANDD